MALLVVFFIVGYMAYYDYRYNVLIVNVGLPSGIINPIIMIACFFGIVKAVYHIVKF
ncbi:MAG: hypothetical protein KKF44_08170 [Nanoarchaeota archaeon]|nr:hypothetical protein [Nanoarchaeota archaeon]